MLNIMEFKERISKQEFEVNSTVIITRGASNASDFNRCGIDIMGIYSIHDWENKEFKIAGIFEPITFTHNPKVYGAYPLMFDNKIVGYVYNTAIVQVYSSKELNSK